MTTAWDAWGYDAAGNRNSETHNSSNSTAFTHDALNRMSQSANWTGSAFGTAFSYTHDVRGNRTQRGSSTVQNSGYALYTFDELNRMTKQASAGNGATFMYRADGQRTAKIKSHSLTWNVTGQDSGFYDEDEVTNQPTTRYMHDGQMVIEEDYQSDVLNDVPFMVTRYGLGARGIDYIEKFDGVETTTHAYPIYDGHGNMVSTVSKSGTGYAYGVTRVSDAWGQLAWGASDGIQQRYCASLGHQKDDETGGLVYMRARYYEPTSGRFIGEDPAMDGWNWFIYCENQPTELVDPSGRNGVPPVEIGDYWIRFDRAYMQEGLGTTTYDLTWGRRGSNALGFIRSDGTVKHGAELPEALKKLIRKDGNTMKKVRARGGFGLAADSIRASFQVDPILTLIILSEAIGGVIKLNGW